MVAALLVALVTAGASAQDAKSVISAASKAMGAEGLNSITYSGTAADVAFLQSRMINLPLRPITNYVRAIDLTQPALRSSGATNNPPGGGTTGPPAPGVFNQNITAQQAVLTQAWAPQLEIWLTPWGFLKGAAANNATGRTQRVSGKNYTVLSWSPAVKAPSGASYVINGYVSEQNMIDRVETWVGDNVLGDMHVLVTYADYKDFGGVKVPSKIVQTRGGLPFFETTVTAARANPSDIAALLTPPPAAGGGRGGPAGAPGAGAPGGGRGAGAPAGAPRGAPGAAGGAGGGRGAAAAGAPPGAPGGGRGAAAPGGAPAAAGGQRGGGAPGGGGAPAAASSEKLAEGVWRITGGYVSLAVEFEDYIMVLEGANSDARALAIIAEAKRVIPGKPIRYVFNTHPHSDHSTGLSAFVAEGATIVTHQNNKKFFEDAYSTPRTLLATTDALAKAQADAAAKKQTLKPKVEGVGDKKVFKDDKGHVELYYMRTNLGKKPEPEYTPHSEGWMIAYLPKEKILFQGDFTINANPANDHVMQVLMPNLDRLKLDWEKYVPVHAANPDVVQTRAEVMKAVGRQ
jgi:glyoxylase-like metal-dependent hydrolase (beta-lactamase superfamily II)